jgi:membrane associated rhomboid family serine protease
VTESVPITTCYRHPDRRAGVSCQRCERPICPSCMVQASVGFQCPECVKGAARSSPVLRMGDLRASGRPIVTQVLIAVNVLAMVAVGIQGGSFLQGGGQLWRDGVLVGYGEEVVASPTLGFRLQPIGVAEGELYRIVSGGFLHAGLLHLGMNMLLLYLLGAQLEPLLGRLRFATLYLACLVAGSFGVLLVSPTAVTVGASGAVFGLMGAALAAQRLAPHRVALANIGALIVVNLLFTFLVPNVSVGAHVGGLVAGVLVGALVIWLETKVGRAWLGALVCLAVTAVLVAGCVWAADSWADPIL